MLGMLHAEIRRTSGAEFLHSTKYTFQTVSANRNARTEMANK